ncbi:MAG: arylmalonate decarboxylase [Gammaproteobacteria bacterium]|jgi:arylmalonate decarboxylase
MQQHRRQILAAIASALGYGLLDAKAMAASTPPKLGLIFPPANRGVPEEGLVMYGNRIEYVTEGLGLETMTPAGYEAVIDRIPAVAKRLVARGAQAVILTGTSLTFFKGEAFNQRLTQTMREAAGGLPVTTMSTAVIEGLKKMGARRVVAPTAYNDEVNERLRAFLIEHKFEVVAVQGMGIEAIEDVNRVTQPMLLDFCTKVVKSAPGADAILVSCGGLRTLEILAPLEAATRLPAVSSMPHTLLAAAKLVGLDGHVSGFGRLLAEA